MNSRSTDNRRKTRRAETRNRPAERKKHLPDAYTITLDAKQAEYTLIALDGLYVQMLHACNQRGIGRTQTDLAYGVGIVRQCQRILHAATGLPDPRAEDEERQPQRN